MKAKVIEFGRASARIREQLKERVACLRARNIRPGLAVLLVGEDPASQVYVRNKVAACEQVGIHSVTGALSLCLDGESTARPDCPRFNGDPAINGILR